MTSAFQSLRQPLLTQQASKDHRTNEPTQKDTFISIAHFPSFWVFEYRSQNDPYSWVSLSDISPLQTSHRSKERATFWHLSQSNRSCIVSLERRGSLQTLKVKRSATPLLEVLKQIELDTIICPADYCNLSAWEPKTNLSMEIHQ